MADWDSYCTRYLDLKRKLQVDEEDWDANWENLVADCDTIKENLVADFSPHCPPTSSEDIAWFREALSDDKRKFFAAFALEKPRTVPETLYEPMIRAAVSERDPSKTGRFVEPCLSTFGLRRVNETLLDRFEHGSDSEKACAVQAMYWACGLVQPTEHDYNNPETAVAIEAMKDTWMRRRCLLLLEFVNNPSPVVRQRIIPHLELKKSSNYPQELQHLVPQAIQIAKNNPDRYIRHRFEIQMGSGKTQSFSPLPSMDRADEGGWLSRAPQTLVARAITFLKVYLKFWL
jgi:hypothetical protein